MILGQKQYRYGLAPVQYQAITLPKPLLTYYQLDYQEPVDLSEILIEISTFLLKKMLSAKMLSMLFGPVLTMFFF